MFFFLTKDVEFCTCLANKGGTPSFCRVEIMVLVKFCIFLLLHLICLLTSSHHCLYLTILSYFQIERDTFGMLQCHPHPGNFSDKSKTFHCCFFMGLQRRQGAPVNEGRLFDISATVNEFKHLVSMYTLWKPGMEIQVSHIRRQNLPCFVFPNGVRRSRVASGEGKMTRSRTQPDKSCVVDEIRKRKLVEDNVENTVVGSKRFAALTSDGCSETNGSESSILEVRPVNTASIEGDNDKVGNSTDCFIDVTSGSAVLCSKESQEITIEKVDPTSFKEEIEPSTKQVNVKVHPRTNCFRNVVLEELEVYYSNFVHFVSLLIIFSS